ncbi:hypothetical protein PXH67_14490 [Streptomyces sp. P8-A8]|uniref:hypothetical protein n=1 Tax=Streptomyces sp. P8-A8 TaxID=3029759 RepID=UPI0036DA99D3
MSRTRHARARSSTSPAVEPAAGPDFISLQACELDASQAFYEQYLGLVRPLR